MSFNKQKIEIGKIDLLTKSTTNHRLNKIEFTCNFSTQCCTIPDVPLTEFDIKRIEDNGYELDQIIEVSSPIFHFVKNQGTEKNYWIKKKPFDGTCTFLKENKCSIHQFKPFNCRIFPFFLMYPEQDIVEVSISRLNICKSIKFQDCAKGDNKRILENIRDEILLEDKYRKKYNQKYVNTK